MLFIIRLKIMGDHIFVKISQCKDVQRLDTINYVNKFLYNYLISV